MEKWREDLYSDALYHHGIKGQKWGRRRYQNTDGTLTAAGKDRYKHPDGYLTRAGVEKYLNKKSDKRYEKLSKDCEKLDRLHSSLDTSGLSESDIDNIFDVAYTKVGREITRSLSELDKKTISAYAHDTQLQEELLEKRGFTKQTSGLALVAMSFADNYEALSDTDKRSYDKLSNDIFSKYNLDEKLFGKQVKHSAMNDSDYKDIGRQWVEELSDGLEHHGIKGQRKGHRRYQNEDGSLTSLGRIHYGVGAPREGSGKYESGSSKVFGGRGGKFARKSASREDDFISRMKDIHERDAEERNQWNREVSESVAKNVQSIMEAERAQKAEPADLKRMREENENIAKMLDCMSKKDFDSVVDDIISKADLGKGAKTAAKYIDKDAVSKSAKDAAEAAKNGKDPDAAFAASLIENVGKNVRKDKAKNGGGPSGVDAAKATVAFFKKYKDLPAALNALGSQSGKIASLYNEVKAYQRVKAIDLNSMSDDDLRTAINRLTLEQNYTRLVASNVSAGERKVNNFINGTGASLQIGGSIVQLANAISKARNPGQDDEKKKG